jgi:hypothetical protein
MFNTLTFDELSEEEQDQYLALINKINGKLLERFVKSLGVKVVLFMVTGGFSVLLSAPLWIWRTVQNANAVDAVKAYVNGLKDAYNCEYINWNTFSLAHLVIGGEKLSSSATNVKCPICKSKTLQQFSTDHNRDLMICGNCNKSIIVKYSGINKRQAEQLIIPGFYAIPLVDAVGDALHLDLGDLSSFFEGLLDFLF